MGARSFCQEKDVLIKALRKHPCAFAQQTGNSSSAQFSLTHCFDFSVPCSQMEWRRLESVRPNNKVIFPQLASVTEEDKTVLPFTKLTICYILWSDSCAELGPSRPPSESLTVQRLPARVELSQAIFVSCCIPAQTLDHRIGDCQIALADHGDRVGPRSPIGCPGTPTC